jgi:hypothetical protein
MELKDLFADFMLAVFVAMGLLVAAVLLFAAGMGIADWWKMRRCSCSECEECKSELWNAGDWPNL